MKSIIKLVALLAVVAAIVTLIVKYFDVLVDWYYRVKEKCCAWRCCDDEVAFDDIDLDELCAELE